MSETADHGQWQHRPHAFRGRHDRDCEICGRRDLDKIHKTDHRYEYLVFIQCEDPNLGTFHEMRAVIGADMNYEQAVDAVLNGFRLREGVIARRAFCVPRHLAFTYELERMPFPEWQRRAGQ